MGWGSMCVVEMAFVLAVLTPHAAARNAVAHSEPTWRVGLHDAKPFAYRDTAGAPLGICVEILGDIANREGWSLEWVDGSWAECLERLERGSIDLLFPIARTPDRSSSFDFTEVELFATWGRVFAPARSGIESILDLEGKRVGVVREDLFRSGIEHLAREFQVTCELVEHESLGDVLAAIENGDVEAAALEALAGSWHVNPRLIRATPIVFQPSFPHVAAPRGKRRELLATLDRNLREMKADAGSVYYDAFDRYLGGARQGRVPAWAFWGFGAAISLCVLFLGFSWALRSQVRARTSELVARNAELMTEMTEHARVQEQLRLSQRMDAVGQIAAGIAHDISNMIVVLGIQIDRLRASLERDGVGNDALDSMVEALRQADTMARTLLALGGRLSTKKSPLDLSALVERSAAMLNRTLPRKVRVHVDLPPGAKPWIEGDDQLVQQVLLNLSLNARDAMPEGGTLTISLSPPERRAGRTGRRCCLVVSDTGSGIAPDRIGRIFDPFYSTKDRTGGTGLGLAIVRGIVEEHGGTIETSSRVGRGSTFRLYFPCVEPAGGPAGAAEAPVLGGSVLLAEADGQIRQILTAAMKAQGWRVHPVSSGREAEEAVALHADLDLVVMDADLPDTSWEKLLGYVEALGVTAPALILSSSPIDDPGPDRAVLLKPFRTPEMNERIEALLRGRVGVPS